jgi:hypothetical protein
VEPDLILPDAHAIQIDGLAIARWQRITYPLRPNQTLNDVYRHLENYGWSRDHPAEQRLLRDQMNYSSSFGAFTRQHLFDLFSEIALVRTSQTDQRGVEIEIFRCFRFLPLTRCL